MTKTNGANKSNNVEHNRPFLGLRSFEEKNKSQFGGRDYEINTLFNLIEDNNLTVVFGTSGIGKTSLLKAGSMPKLRQKFYFPIYIRIDYSSSKTPNIQLRELVYNAMKELDSSIAEMNSETIWEYLHDVNLLNGLVTPVLIFDQFEEIFTLGKNNKGVNEFVAELADLAQNRIPATVKEKYIKEHKTVPSRYSKLPYRIVLSLREDYLARLDELKKYIPTIMDHVFRVVQMTISQAMEAAIKPGKGLIEEEVAKAIIKKLPGVSQADFDLLQQNRTDNKALKVEPFLLSLICDRLNEKRIEKDLNTITEDLVSQFKVDDVISSFYEDTIKKYDSNVDKAIQNELLDAEGYRKLHALKEFQNEYDISNDVIDELVESRIVRKENRNSVDYIELIHDVLAPVIKKKRDDRLKAEHEAKRKAELKKQEEEREAAIQQEKERIRKRNRRRASIIVPIVLFIAVVALWSSISVWRNNEMVKNMNKSLDLLNNSKSELIYSGKANIAASYTIQAYKLFKENKNPEKGHNIFEQLYYESLLKAYMMILAKHDNGLNINYSINHNKGVLNISKEYNMNDEPPEVSGLGINKSGLKNNINQLQLDDGPPEATQVAFNKEGEKNLVDYFQDVITISDNNYLIGFGRGKVQKLIGEIDENKYDSSFSYNIKTIINNQDKWLPKTLPFWKTQSISFNNKNLLAIAGGMNFINIYNVVNEDLYNQINTKSTNIDDKNEEIKSIEFTVSGELLGLKANIKDEIYSLVKWEKETFKIKDWDYIEDQQFWTWKDSNDKTKGFTKEIISVNDPAHLEFGQKLLKFPIIIKNTNNIKLTRKLNCFSTSSNLLSVTGVKNGLVIGVKNGIIILTKDQYIEISDKKFMRTTSSELKEVNLKISDSIHKSIIKPEEDYFGEIVVANFNPTGEYLVIGNKQGQVFIVKFELDKVYGKIIEINVEKLKFFHEEEIVKIAFHPNDSKIDMANFATADRNGLVVVWKMENGYWSSIPLNIKILDKIDEEDTFEVRGLNFIKSNPYLMVFYNDNKNTIIRWPTSMDELNRLISNRLDKLNKIETIKN